MADSLANLKYKLRSNILAHTSANGIIPLSAVAQIYNEELDASMSLTDKETKSRMAQMVERVVCLNAEFRNKDNEWSTLDEWTETMCRHLIKHPRIHVAKWSYWFTNLFDILDEDHDGLISKDQFNMVYDATRWKNNKEFMDRAFYSIDTSRTGTLSKAQFVDAFMTYMTDPDVPAHQYPLF